MPSTEGRLIDKEKGTRTRPMKVLVLGAARTGTTCKLSEFAIYLPGNIQLTHENSNIYRLK